ncbi:hypothetical protein LCGC14_1499470 [marine sediment metagenome]|uniref:Uncharacterized protein n=1 Tax=marine sediment metagenome TaxID=412755 RepID=A0A0F9J4F5_9ZZZZ|nr:hypothetical protein [Candidatus Scalindua sp.]
MSKRYYYTDPLKAVIACRDYRVKFTHCTSFVCSSYGHGINRPYFYEVLLRSDEEKIYIHPDSMPIFEPQEGDLISGFIQYDEETVFRHITKCTNMPWINAINDKEIIQRNGKIFPWYCGVEEGEDD